MTITVNRKPVHFNPDPKRVIARFFFPGSPERAQKIISRIMELSDEDAFQTLNQTLRDFSDRHRNITKIFKKHFGHVHHLVKQAGYEPDSLSQERQLLIGSYFTHEYSIESAAFFNPSMVEDPDQANLLEGQKRVIVSFRATGEGHISSLVFRGGIIDKNNHLTFKPSGKLVDEAETIQDHVYHKDTFIKKLIDMRSYDQEIVDEIMSHVGEKFLFSELQQSVKNFIQHSERTYSKEKVVEAMIWLAHSHYEITFSLDTAISERVIFPIADTESNGIEDARFVRFTEDDGTVKYYATYTAYNGISILPKLIETRDFYHFKVRPIFGKNSQNKGMALFPRKINGRYAILSRLDGENNYIMFSDVINLWEEPARLIQEPLFPWEFVQIGNAGSPIETSHGWLVITHGVGAMRRYSLGAIMLDLDDPTVVLAQITEPVLMPNDDEREGYVPNVVYSCGSIIHNNELIIPYAMADYSSGFASVPLDEILEKMFPGESKQKKQKEQKDSNKLRALLVESDLTERKTITGILERNGYQVEIATDGLHALVELGKHHIDLILADIEMTNLTGYQLLEFLNSKNVHIPVFFLISRSGFEDKIKGLKPGAAEFLFKPVQPDLLKIKLKKHFSNG